MDDTVKRATSFFIVFGVLLLAAIIIMYTPLYTWHAGSSTVHTLLQAVATLVALFTGAAALFRYYSGQKVDEMILFIGIGFIGTTLIDAYHAIVTATWFAKAFPNISPTVAEWSWFSTRMLLSILMLLSLPALFKKKEVAEGNNGKIAYTIVGIVTVLILVIFMQLPVDYPVYSNTLLDRPLEVIPGCFFLIALIGYLMKGQWRTEKLSYWMVMFLIVSVCTQFFFIDQSPHGHDALYTAAHILKMISYAMVYIGVTS